MRIDKLEITNFKKFDAFTLNLHPQFTLLVGDNGSGKTTLLDALAVSAGIWLVKPPDTSLTNSGRHISRQEIHLVASVSGDRTQFTERKPVRIQATGELAGHQVQWTRQIPEGGFRTSNKEAKNALEIVRKVYEKDNAGEHHPVPILAYYGAGRAWLPSATRSPKSKPNGPAKRWDAFYDCFEERIRIGELQTWFQKEALAAINRKGGMRPGYTAVKKTILRCIPEADDMWFDPDLSEIVLSVKGIPHPFSNLSSGQKMMTAMVADIAIKAVTQNAWLLSEDLVEDDTSDRIFATTPGLILIDEIDVHLHPTWQRRVVEDLKTNFPELQFVCTTHSPFIIQSIDQGELRILDSPVNSGVEYANRSIEDIAESIQQVETPQQSLKALHLAETTKRYFELLQQSTSASESEIREAELAYRKAASTFSENPGLSALLELEALSKSGKANK